MKEFSAKLFFIFVLMFFIVSCDDYGLSPPGSGSLGPGLLTGNVYFIGEMPENVQYCWVVVAYDRPPGDELDYNYLAKYYEIPLPLPSDTVPFSMELAPNTYNWVFVAAIGNIDSIGIWNVVGQYFVQGDTIPKPITIDYNDSLWIEITADLTDAYIP